MKILSRLGSQAASKQQGGVYALLPKPVFFHSSKCASIRVDKPLSIQQLLPSARLINARAYENDELGLCCYVWFLAISCGYSPSNPPFTAGRSTPKLAHGVAAFPWKGALAFCLHRMTTAVHCQAIRGSVIECHKKCLEALCLQLQVRPPSSKNHDLSGAQDAQLSCTRK